MAAVRAPDLGRRARGGSRRTGGRGRGRRTGREFKCHCDILSARGSGQQVLCDRPAPGLLFASRYAQNLFQTRNALPDFLQAHHLEGQHAVGDGLVGQLPGICVLQHQLPDRIVNH